MHKVMFRMRTLLAILLLSSVSAAVAREPSELILKRTIGAWKRADWSDKAQFAVGIAKAKGAHYVEGYRQDLMSCLDEKAATLPPETHLGKIIDECAEPVPTEAEVRAKHRVAIKLNQAAKLKIVVFTTDDDDGWTARSVAGEEPEGRIMTPLLLKMDALKEGASAADVIKAMGVGPDWVSHSEPDRIRLTWFNGRCSPVEAQLDKAGKFIRRGGSAMCQPPKLSWPLDSTSEDEDACSLHPAIVYCNGR